jgi:hypothetical protein
MPDPQVSRDALYKELRANIRATDEISFKLMGLVPLLSGAAFLTFFSADKVQAKPNLVVALSLFAGLVTLGLFRWELRNIQNCSWLLRCSEALEKEAPGLGSTWPRPPHGFGKTEAEKAVYSVTILMWLLMPAIACPLEKASSLMLACYAVLAPLTAVVAGLSALTSVRVVRTPPEAPQKGVPEGGAP